MSGEPLILGRILRCCLISLNAPGQGPWSCAMEEQGAPDEQKHLPTSRARRTSRTSGGPGRCGPSGRSTSTSCRPATTPARPARTSRPGSPRRRPGASRRRGGSSSRDNPLPAVHGRVCYHPCEDSCNRKHLDSAVSIHAVERFLGDLAIEQGWRFDARPRAPRASACWWSAPGRPGLSAAYHLARLGHAVEIRDAGPLPGGMMHFGIPAYRLPRAVLEAEIGRIEELGVKIVLESQGRGPRGRDGGRPVRRRASSPSARISASGPRSPRAMPARCSTPSRSCATSRPTKPPKLGRGRGLRRRQHGDGRGARGAAARRHEPMIIYRRDRAHMPAHEFEADGGRSRGREDPLAAHHQVDRARPPSRSRSWRSTRRAGRSRPGEFETLEADTLILALGQDTDTRFLQEGRRRRVPGGRHGRRRPAT